MRVTVLLAVASVLSGSLVAAWVVPTSPRSQSGWALYERYCLACHGASGDGRGPAAPYTRGVPRDFTTGDHAWRTTATGQPPTDDDLRLTIRRGAPGTSMPGFDLPPAQIDELVAVVKAFAPKAFAVRASPIKLAAPANPDPARGAELWLKAGCSTCHGPDGSGTSPAARALPSPPYDLRRDVLHRPRTGDKRTAAAWSIATGRSSMPGYAGALPDADIWALADHVVALNISALDRTTLDDRAIERDRTKKIGVGRWPGTDPDEAVIWGGPVAPQGPAPAALAPVQTSLSAQQCARCHNKQFREWTPSLHAGATSPGLAAQMLGMKPAEAARCLDCHAPLAEQRSDRALHAQGLQCAGCHVRNWTRHGPPNVAPSLLPIAGYPLATLPLYERADFCVGCHQLPPRTALEGRPLLDTYREWLEGPYMKRGIQCQHCHMPNREHTFLGIHDRETFRQGIELTARAHVKSGSVTVVATLANVGAGHYLPTTPTPAAWLSIELLDARGKPIAGATDKHRIGRDIYFDGAWHQRADTRIPPGERITMARAWNAGRIAEAVTARIVVEVHPDDYYDRLYQQRLAGKLTAERRTLYDQALARARANRYIAEQRDIPITRN